MNPAGCERFRATVSDLVSGVDLPEAEGPWKAHAASCEDCESFAQSLVWQDRVLAELAARARLDTLTERLRVSIGDTVPVSVSVETPAPLRLRVRRPSWGRRAAVAALFLAALAGAAMLGKGRRPDERSLATGAAGRPAPQVKPELPPVPAPQPEPELPPPEKTATAQIETAAAPSPVPAVSPAPPRAVVQAPVPSPKDPVPAPRPPDRVAPRPPDTVAEIRTPDQAVRQAVAYLKGKCEGLDRLRSHHDLRADELVLWTMLHAGVPEGDPEFQRMLKGVVERRLERTYPVALQAMVLEELDRVKYQWRIQQCAQFLVDNQSRGGTWGYGDPSIFVEDIPVPKDPAKLVQGRTAKDFEPAAPGDRPKPKVVRRVTVKKQRDVPEGGDHSNSMYAALGLRACAEAGVAVPREVLEAAARAWRDALHKNEGGWCYGRHPEHKPYGSMTAGGVGSLIIYDHLLGRDWRRDRDVQAGLDWLAKHFSVTWNPGWHEHAQRPNSGHHLYYYLYALERAARMAGLEQIGRREWHAEGTEALLATQRPDGAWESPQGGNDIQDTCFAVLFLRRATRVLPDV
ncbi:MAG TPA: prenyltransferase/squalene oxidase repeat-containing protein, partial [Planctomycetota bacterium]|nr:prenyltransferase/squalene oxidase repeat-containing protein [Planctomycetota bacterium]